MVFQIWQLPNTAQASATHVNVRFFQFDEFNHSLLQKNVRGESSSNYDTYLSTLSLGEQICSLSRQSFIEWSDRCYCTVLSSQRLRPHINMRLRQRDTIVAPTRFEDDATIYEKKKYVKPTMVAAGSVPYRRISFVDYNPHHPVAPFPTRSLDTGLLPWDAPDYNPDPRHSECKRDSLCTWTRLLTPFMKLYPKGSAKML